jgi:endonuclease YncB( thermonuclease family)
MDTPEGKAAKRFVETLVAQAVSITITTTKPDKYDRYLSDIFLQTDSGDEIFLNNALLENGHAVCKDSYTPSDWEDPEK